MFEKKIKSVLNDTSPKKEYYILSREKHKREVYFQNTQKAVKFIKVKFNSPFKNIIYLLIKAGIIQLFLKRIQLSPKFGEVIFVADQIKIFDLEKDIVTSFSREDKNKKNFLESKKFQKKAAEKGFAPEIIKIDSKTPYSQEEIIKLYSSDSPQNYEKMFKKLIEFYNVFGIQKISLKRYVSSLKKKVKDPFLTQILEEIGKKNFRIYSCTVHGDFSKEQVLVKGREFLFIDWHPYKGLIIDDLVSFFKGEQNILKNELLRSIRKPYPKEVKKNIKDYLILSEISLFINRKRDKSQTIKRIKKHLESK